LDTWAQSGLGFGEGGAVHIDTVQISNINFKTVVVYNSFAEKDGGVIAVSKMKGEIKISDASKITHFKVD
jgi:hypothetical protein